jgi:Spy/CpxP family protein refolding chaperone
MNTGFWTKRAAVLVASAILGTAVVTGADGRGELGGAIRERIRAAIATLGITDQQRTEIREVLREFKPDVQPKIEKLVQERRTLREVIRTTPVDEAAIRAQSAKVAALEADLAVDRARVGAKVRPILTEEQLAKLQQMTSNEFMPRSRA